MGVGPVSEKAPPDGSPSSACAGCWPANDKLPGACEYPLLDAAAQLDQAISTLEYVANEGQKDIDSLCAGVIAGSDRILACLTSAESKVSPGCARAIEQTGLKDAA